MHQVMEILGEKISFIWEDDCDLSPRWLDQQTIESIEKSLGEGVCESEFLQIEYIPMSERGFYKASTYRGFWKVAISVSAKVKYDFTKSKLIKPKDYIDVSEFFTDENGNSTIMLHEDD